MKSHALTAVRRLIMTSVAGWALVPAVAMAQVAHDPGDPQTEKVDQQAAGGAANISSEAPADGDIVVTGTLLRGAAPVGSSIISAGLEKIESSGASTANEVLATIPQVTNLFGTDVSRRYGIAANQVQIARPNLRNIGPDNASSSATLVLFDGHRVASAGVTGATSPDPDLLPTAAIERVEVVTDGGSAIYGADAVGGVINFITRKKFDGVQVDARYGFADDYWHFDANAIAGKDWGSGSAYVAYTYSKNDALFGRDRSYINSYLRDAQGNIITSAGNPFGFGGQTCAAPNFTTNVGATATAFHSVNGVIVPGTNFCDTSENGAIIPEVERHGVLASLTQDLNDALSINVRAFYSQRNVLSRGEFTLSGVNIPSTNAFYQQIPGGNVGAAQTVSLSLAPAIGLDRPSSGSSVKEWGANAELKASLSDNWQLRTLFNYSNTDSSYFLRNIDNTALVAAAGSNNSATALNPYNIALTPASVLQGLLNSEGAGQTKFELVDLRAILDGTLFTLPGGDVRLAAGYEYMYDIARTRVLNTGAIGLIQTTPYGVYSRRVHSLFGELQIPIFGSGNAVPGIQSLVISAQGRYDHYSDFGGTFNPKIGVNYKPVDWLTLRGNWSKSFTAPTTLDQLGATGATVAPFTGFALFLFSLEDPGTTFGLVGRGAALGAIQGAQTPLRPQTAETWSVGFDVDPPFINGLHASLSYYRASFNNIISTPSPFSSGVFAAFPNQSLLNGTTSASRSGGLTRADAIAFFQSRGFDTSPTTPIGAAIYCNGNDATCLTPGPTGTLLYAALDFRKGNYGIQKVSGLDWNVNYRMNTGFGSVDASFAGNLQLGRPKQLSPGSAVVDELTGLDPVGARDLLIQATLGANIGDHLRAQATYNSVSGKFKAPSPGQPDNYIDGFQTVDLFFKYDFKGAGLSRDLSLTANVRNLFNQHPPFVHSGNGYDENGASIIGREFIFGISKKF